MELLLNSANGKEELIRLTSYIFSLASSYSDDKDFSKKLLDTFLYISESRCVYRLIYAVPMMFNTLRGYDDVKSFFNKKESFALNKAEFLLVSFVMYDFCNNIGLVFILFFK